MSFSPFFLDIVKFLLAGTGVVGVAFYLIKPYLDREDKTEKIQLLEYKKSISSHTIPLRLQAYERVALFIERASPVNMLVRLNASGYSAHELHALIVEEVRNEYQHNITQQIYVSSRAWAVVVHVKDDTLGIVNKTASALPDDATGLDLAKGILLAVTELENNPYDVAAAVLRNEVQELF